jgi:hypothetical protein
MENKSPLTELVFILDASGSMYDLTDDTIGGFNSMIQKQKDEECNALVTTVLFNNTSVTIHDRKPLNEVSKLTKKEYAATACTALLDAVGSTIEHIATIQKYARDEDKPNRTLFVITTDGEENASTAYTYPKVKSMISKAKEKNGWDFLFIGADIDAVSAAKNIGIDEDFAADVVKDSTGVRASYQRVAKCCQMVCEDHAIPTDWKKELTEDYQKRKKK